MIITKSNVLDGVTPTIVSGASGDNPASLTDPDFSTNYTSSSASTLAFDCGATGTISYVAIAGILAADPNASTPARMRIANVGGSWIRNIQVNRNHAIVATFEPQSFSNLRIQLEAANTVSNPTISYIAAGLHFEVPNNGEQAGYNRQFLARNYKQKTTSNGRGAPTAILRERTPAKGKLNLRNMTREFTENEWQEFLDFSQDNHFFIREQAIAESSTSQINNSAYICYNIKDNRVTAHNLTRALNDCSLSFEVFNGL